MKQYYKIEGNILYPSKDEDNRHMLTWGPFYYHSYTKGKEKMNEIMEWIVSWVNEKDNTLNIKPENVIRCTDDKTIVFKIKAWRDYNHLENCDGIITIENIFFEDEDEA